jgi:hypothetical protein
MSPGRTLTDSTGMVGSTVEHASGASGRGLWMVQAPPAIAFLRTSVSVPIADATQSPT